MIQISFAPKRKSRYFIISYGVKKLPEAQKAQEKQTSGSPVRIPLQEQNGNGHGSEMHFASISVTLDPDPKTKEKVTFISRKQAAGIIQEQHPDINHIAIMNIQELKEKDFLDWNA